MPNDGKADLKSDALAFSSRASPGQARDRRRPSRSPTSAISRSPIRPASPFACEAIAADPHEADNLRPRAKISSPC